MKIEYVTEDGARFDDEQEAIKYEAKYNLVTSIMPQAVWNWEKDELRDYLTELVEEKRIKIL